MIIDRSRPGCVIEDDCAVTPVNDHRPTPAVGFGGFNELLDGLGCSAEVL